MGRISPGPTRWPPGAERCLVPANSNLKPQTSTYPRPHGDSLLAPPNSPTLSDVIAAIIAGLQEARAPQQADDEMPQAPPPAALQDHPHQEHLAHPITRMGLTPQHRTTPAARGTETCHRNGRSTTARSGGTKSHQDSKLSASTGSPNTPTPGHYQQTATTSSSPSKGMPRLRQRGENP